MKAFRCVAIFALVIVAWSEEVCSQLSSPQLAELIFRERYRQPQSGGGFVGDENLGYLEPYGAGHAADTGLSHHAGIDYRARSPEPVYSPVSGRILYACQGQPGPAGLGALAIYVDDDSVFSTPSGVRIEGYTLIFLHLSECSVQTEELVEVGTRLGLSGSVGTGAPHVHVEVQRGEDMFPCGTGGGVDTGCPFNGSNPTPLGTIANSTYDPRTYLRRLLFARDLNGQLMADTIARTGKVRLSGMNFGNLGRVEVKADMSSNSAFVECTGGRELQWDVIPRQEEWRSTEIEASIFPHTEQLCGEPYSITPEGLSGSLTIRVIPSNGGGSNSIVFPFKDVPIDEWFDNYVVELWAAGIVEGFKGEFDGVLQSENRFSPEAGVTNGEAVKMIMVSFGVEPDAECNCSGTPSNHWAHPFVCEGQRRGWLSCPLTADEAARRGFVAKSLALALGMPEMQRSRGDLYHDIPESHTLGREITFCRELSIFEGYGDGYFRPDLGINRAELSKVLRHAQEALGERGVE